MKYLIIIFLLFVLVSCATEAGYREALDVYVEGSEEYVIDAWGAPDSVYEANGFKYLTYYNNKSVYMPASYNTTFYGNSANTFGYSGGARQISCKTTFKIKDKEVVGYSYEGSACVAK